MHFLNTFSISGRGLHGAAGGCGLQEAGADPGREACAQLHDGHAAHQAGMCNVYLCTTKIVVY